MKGSVVSTERERAGDYHEVLRTCHREEEVQGSASVLIDCMNDDNTDVVQKKFEVRVLVVI
jgi:hypothetical protein